MFKLANFSFVNVVGDKMSAVVAPPNYKRGFYRATKETIHSTRR